MGIVDEDADEGEDDDGEAAKGEAVGTEASLAFSRVGVVMVIGIIGGGVALEEKGIGCFLAQAGAGGISIPSNLEGFLPFFTRSSTFLNSAWRTAMRAISGSLESRVISNCMISVSSAIS